MQILGKTESGETLLRLSDGAVLSFASEVEAMHATNKLETAKAIVEVVQTLTTALDSGPDRWQEYFDVVNAAGAFTDADVSALGITQADLVSCVTLLENMKKFFGGEAVAPDVYRVVVNKVRRAKR